MKIELTDQERVFLASAVKTRWSVRQLATLVGVSHRTDGAAFTDEFVMSLLKKLETLQEKFFQGPGTGGHPTDCHCAACRNFDD